MNENVNELKAWRKQHGFSQQRLADAAGVSLATLRQLEAGSNRPQKRTLTKVFAAIKDVDANPDKYAGKGRKRGRPKGSGKPAKTEKPSLKDVVAKMRGKLPKAAPAGEPAAAPEEKPAEKPKSKPGRKAKAPRAVRVAERKGRKLRAVARKAKVAKAAAPAAAVSTDAHGPIRLNNLDLELISRILGMSHNQKLDLLKKLV